MRLTVTREERYWYPDDGGIVWLAGFVPIDSETGRFLSRDTLRERGLVVAAAAGAHQFHDEVLQSAAVEPGAGVLLRRDPANEHDPNAVRVETEGGEQLGFVPRDIAAELAPKLDAGEEWAALVLREQRASPRDPRTGVTLLLAPQPVELDVR